MSTDDYADQLALVATELTVRVRDDDPEANLRWLAGVLPTERERLDLLFVLASAVPDDRPWTHLTAWASSPRREPTRPCGTPAAAKRHRTAGEQPCTPCAEAEREDWRIRKQHLRARKTETTATTEETRAA